MKLTKNFTLEELCKTDTGLPNSPMIDQEEKLLYLASYLLQPIREKWGPIQINSGFRSPLVHQALTRSGAPTSKTSQHLEGEAADIKPLTQGVTCEVVWDWACKNLTYGQCILEYHNGSTWVHISLPRVGGNNQQAMIFKDGKYELA